MNIHRLSHRIRRGFRKGVILLPPVLWLSGCAVFSMSRSHVAGDSAFPEQVRVPAERTAEALAHFSQGVLYESHGDAEAALDHFLRASETDPDNEVLTLLISRRILDLGEPERALALNQEWLEREPENQTALLWTAQLHLLAGEEALALERLRRLMELAPGLETPYLEVARLLLRQENTEEALRLTRLGVAQASHTRRIRQFHAELLLREAARSEEPLVVDALRDEALALLKESRRLFPDHIPFTLLQAALVGPSSPTSVLPLYRELDEATGRSLEVRNTLLVHFIQSLGENATQAVLMLNAYLRENPEDPFGHYLQGLLAEWARRPDLAIAAYSRVVELDPDEVDAFRKLALFLFQGAEPNRALRVLETALSYHPDHVELLSLKGAVALSAEAFGEALAAFDQLEQMRLGGEPLEEPARFFALRAMSLLAVDRPDDAVEPMLKAAALEEQALEEIWRHQIRLIFRSEDDEELKARREQVGIDALTSLANRLPEDPTVMRMLGRMHLFRREYEAALTAFEETRRLAEAQEDPTRWIHADFLFDVASTLERLGRDEESMAQFDEVIALDPDHAMALNYLAYMWAERAMNLGTALRHVERALELDPQNGAYIDTRGWIFYQMGRYEEAYRDLKRASELEPDESVIAEHMGDVLMKLDRPVEALGYYRIALALGAGEREEKVLAALARAEDGVAGVLRARRREESDSSGTSQPQSDESDD